MNKQEAIQSAKELKIRLSKFPKAIVWIERSNTGTGYTVLNNLSGKMSSTFKTQTIIN